MAKLYLRPINIGDTGETSRNTINHNNYVILKEVEYLDEQLKKYPSRAEVLLGTLLKGQVDNLNELENIAAKDKGDTYKVRQSGVYYTWDGTKWNEIGTLLPNDVVTHSSFCNLSQSVNKYDFANKTEARKAIIESERTPGQIITYRLAPANAGDSPRWINEQFVGQNQSEWDKPEAWRSIGTSPRIFDGGRADTLYAGTRSVNCGGANSGFDGELVDCATASKE